jgi:hypothetical protein
MLVGLPPAYTIGFLAGETRIIAVYRTARPEADYTRNRFLGNHQTFFIQPDTGLIIFHSPENHPLLADTPIAIAGAETPADALSLTGSQFPGTFLYRIGQRFDCCGTDSIQDSTLEDQTFIDQVIDHVFEPVADGQDKNNRLTAGLQQAADDITLEGDLALDKAEVSLDSFYIPDDKRIKRINQFVGVVDIFIYQSGYPGLGLAVDTVAQVAQSNPGIDLK